jgi:methyl-accepting chemotaxis protein
MKKLLSFRLPIATRLALLGVFFVGIAVAASVMVSLQAAEKAMRERAQASLDRQQQPAARYPRRREGEPRLDGDKLYFGSELVNGNFAAVDKVKALAGGTATDVHGDVRIATNVQRPDGSARGRNQAGAGRWLMTRYFKERRTYSGAADILGVPYFTIYEPIIQTVDIMR